MSQAISSRKPDDCVVVYGDVAPHITGYAREKISAISANVALSAPAVRVRLTRQTTDGRVGPVTAQATTFVNGWLVRAQVVAFAPTDAVDLLATRLDHRLRRALRLARREQPSKLDHLPVPAARPRRRRAAATNAIPTKIARRKFVELATLTVDEAALEMHLRDYAFHLFTEARSEQDSVLYRSPPTGYRLAQANPAPRRELAISSLPMTIDSRQPPILTLADAVDELDQLDQHFLLFIDRETRRGNVLYRRYDRRLGLVTPMAAATPDGVTMDGRHRRLPLRGPNGSTIWTPR